MNHFVFLSNINPFLSWHPHTEDENSDKTEAQTFSNLRGNSKLFRKIKQFPAAKFLPSIYTYQYFFIWIVWVFLFRNTEDVVDLGMSRKEVCWISICMLTSAKERLKILWISHPYKGVKERRWNKEKNGEMGGIERQALSHLQLL